jgi:hypothetical protein
MMRIVLKLIVLIYFSLEIEIRLPKEKKIFIHVFKIVHKGINGVDRLESNKSNIK